MKAGSTHLLTLGSMFFVASIVVFIADPEPEMVAIVPLDRETLTGLLTAPLVHYEWPHLLENLGLISICFAVAVVGAEYSVKAVDFVVIYLLSGLLTWLFGEYGLHVGASGVAIGFLFYLVTKGLFSFRLMQTLSALILVVIYGVVVLDIWAPHPGVSIDYHISGALVGIGLALIRTDRFIRRVGGK